MILYFKFWFLHIQWWYIKTQLILYVDHVSCNLAESCISSQSFIVHSLNFLCWQSCHLKIGTVLCLPFWSVCLKDLVEISSETIWAWRFLFRNFKIMSSVSLKVIKLLKSFCVSLQGIGPFHRSCQFNALELLIVFLYHPFNIHRVYDIPCFIPVIGNLCLLSLFFDIPLRLKILIH